MSARGYEFYLRVLKVDLSKIKFVSPRGHVISYIYHILNTDEIPEFRLLLKNHIFTACSKKIVFIFHMRGI